MFINIIKKVSHYCVMVNAEHIFLQLTKDMKEEAWHDGNIPCLQQVLNKAC